MANVQEFRNGKLVNEYDDGLPEPALEPTVADLQEQIKDLQDQATGKITKAQLSAKLASVDAPTRGVI